MSKALFTNAVFSDHTAVLGKTGSGKTSTAKLIVEQAVARGARVCILDPIKSDWWGITVSTDGKKPGLPFDILGGPKAHVPLPPSAGAAIGELVANGSLQRSIIDMADFGPGDLQRFFVEFAQALLKKMRGVVYLVIEEAHEFAPKERAGFDKENMAIHFAKKLATAGRSKGIKLMVLSQRTQALHNALLGSCETLIAHRMTQPADQEPVIKWLKANAPKDIMAEVAGSLSSLKTGTGWVCSGESAIFERREFPRIGTYDNSATPDGAAIDDVKPAPIDTEKLKALLGAAVVEAQSNDPAALKKQVADLQRKIAALGTPPGVPSDPRAIDRAYESGYDAGFKGGAEHAQKLFAGALGPKLAALVGLNDAFVAGLQVAVDALNNLPPVIEYEADAGIKPPNMERPPPPNFEYPSSFPKIRNGDGREKLPKAQRSILSVLAQYPAGRSRNQLALLSGYSPKSSSFDNALSALRVSEYIFRGDPIRISAAGREVAEFEPLPKGDALRSYWLGKLGKAERTLLGSLISCYPHSLNRDDLAKRSHYSAGSSSFDNALSRLRSLELINRGAEIRASEDLFQ